MLVSYQITGLNRDRASISLFEFDPTDNSISPANFIVVSQKIGEVDSAKVSFSSMNSCTRRAEHWGLLRHPPAQPSVRAQPNASDRSLTT